MRSQLRRCGHLTRMPDHRIPKIVFYSEPQQGSRPRGRPKKRYKDSLKDNLMSTGIDINCWESTAASQSTWLATSAQEWWATKISELLVRCRNDNIVRTSPQHRQLSPVNMSAQSVDADVQQRSTWCPIWEFTSSTGQRLICLSR